MGRSTPLRDRGSSARAGRCLVLLGSQRRTQRGCAARIGEWNHARKATRRPTGPEQLRMHLRIRERSSAGTGRVSSFRRSTLWAFSYIGNGGGRRRLWSG